MIENIDPVSEIDLKKYYKNYLNYDGIFLCDLIITKSLRSKFKKTL